MPKLYELSLEVQIKKLRNTAIACLIIGGVIVYNLLVYGHTDWAALIAIITLQAAAGSLIMMGDVKRDLIYTKQGAEKSV